MKNYCRFEIKGLNQERFFNELSKEVQIFDIERKSKDHTFFKVKLSKCKQTKKKILGAGFEIVSERKAGVLNQFLTVFSSYGLVLGIILGTVFYFLQASFIRKIEVWGNEKYLDSEIACVIKENIGSGFKSNLHTKELENLVYASFDGLSFVSISIVGQTLVVNVKEELRPDEMAGQFEPIYSNFDGIITSVQLIQGTLCVKVGDIIQAGQILVLPETESSNGQKFPVKPMANIFADVWAEGAETVATEFEETYRTGNTLTRNEVFLLNLKVYEKQICNNFENFEVEESTKSLVKNNLLPFVLKTTTFYETEKRIVKRDFEQLKDELTEKARAKALQNLSGCEIIKSERVTVREVGNIKTIVVTVTTNRNIGE